MRSRLEDRTFKDIEDFFRSLFDFSFRELITPRILRVIFGLGIGAAFIFAAVHASRFAGGVLTILIFFVLFLFYVLLVRVLLELIMVFFRIAENTESGERQMEAASEVIRVETGETEDIDG